MSSKCFYTIFRVESLNSNTYSIKSIKGANKLSFLLVLGSFSLLLLIFFHFTEAACFAPSPPNGLAALEQRRDSFSSGRFVSFVQIFIQKVLLKTTTYIHYYGKSYESSHNSGTGRWGFERILAIFKRF